ncbi:hypothetical protein [Corynebacterium timonense]|uniref:Uncharacterized protein n=1 Tax=Corynebacterium timonense TaxID=441500 RepID=A0A1H1MD36_9CORY|nr:hypothetical protein [Corynebacterium timonense]SDR84678.1 hypothetical protein SAMN04488539_0499 [Corynebacterium timonense]
MSTAHTPSPDANAGPDAATQRPLLARVPGPLFTAGYGALLVGVVVMGVLLVSYESEAEQPPAVVERPQRPILPAPASQDDVDASVRTYLIADPATARTPTGVTLTGTMTEHAQDDTADFAGHVSRLLQQNCVDNMTVRTQDNMRINFWGFCYSSLPEQTIRSYVDDGLRNGAQDLSFYFHPGRKYEHSVWFTWSETSQEEADAIASRWRQSRRLEGVDRLTLIGYGPETVQVFERTRNGVWEHSAPTGEPFKELYDLPTPALGAPS